MSTSPTVVIVFGAAVWEGGRASNAMRRRIDGALRSAHNSPDALFLVTGGVGKHPPSEASAMARLLEEAGVSRERILLDESARDTLESVRNCAAILKSLPSFGEIQVCSDNYHIPRCRWLFKLCGIDTRAGNVASGRSQNTAARWFYYYLRELPAIAWDTFLVLISKTR